MTRTCIFRHLKPTRRFNFGSVHKSKNWVQVFFIHLEPSGSAFTEFGERLEPKFHKCGKFLIPKSPKVFATNSCCGCGLVLTNKSLWRCSGWHAHKKVWFEWSFNVNGLSVFSSPEDMDDILCVCVFAVPSHGLELYHSLRTLKHFSLFDKA